VIDFIDATLKQLLESQVTAKPVSVAFEVPNDAWRTRVSASKGNWLDVYLIEMRENRKLRSNELITDWVDGVQMLRPVPARLDCHYLVSAWTRAAINASPMVEATEDEWIVLYDAARVLMNNIPLDVASIYPTPSTLPPVLLEQPLPMVVAMPEGFGKLPDFWTRMDWVWKPVIEVVITVPVVAVQRLAGPPVTTIFSELLQVGAAESTEELVTIGGTVWSATDRVPNASVRILELERVVNTDSLGRFEFQRVPRGAYHFEVRAVGHPVTIPPVPVDVPSGSGSYDLAVS
jgi:hypothetical protein